MSSRAIRRAQQNQLPSLKVVDESDESSTSEDESTALSNPFNLLNDDDEQPAQEDSDSESKEEKKEPQQTQAKAVKPQPQPSRNKAVKKKASAAAAPKKSKAKEDFDELISQYSAADRQVMGDLGQTDTKTKMILQIDAKYLDPANELRQMFGSSVLKAQGNRGRGHPGRSAAHAKRILTKKTKLLKPKEYWPPMTDDLRMELIETKKGINYFKFIWTHKYREAQTKFFACVNTGDPNTLAMLLQHHPYHTDTLLQLYEALKVTGDKDTAEDLMERIMYRFESAWHTRFDPIRDGNCRLPYEHIENRTFFLALFTRIESLGRRGCIKTALELCKLLLTIELTDPLGVLYMIDHYALRTKSYEFLLRLYASPMFEEKGLSMLPNFLYSVALAKFHLENGGQKSNDELPITSTSSELLQNAMLMFPQVVIPLLEKCGLKDVAVEVNSGQKLAITSCKFFSSAPELPAVRLMAALYAERNGSHLWKTEMIHNWVKDALTAVVRRVLDKDPIIESYTTLVNENYSQPVMQNLHRHILLTDTPNVSQLLPPEILRDGFRIYDEETMQQRQVTGLSANPLFQFLYTLLPFQNAEQRPQLDPNLINQLVQEDDVEDDIDFVTDSDED